MNKLKDMTSFNNAIDKAVDIVEGRSIFDDSIVVDVEVYHEHIAVLKEHGTFLALIDEKHHQKVAMSIVIALEQYNQSIQKSKKNCLFPKIFYSKRDKDLKKAEVFLQSLSFENEKTIETFEGNYEINSHTKKYSDLIKLVEEYIKELSDKQPPLWKMIPIEKYMTTPKKTKTPIKNLLDKITKKYGIENVSLEKKNLVDKF